MPALAHRADHADGAVSVGHQPVDERGLADAGVAHQHRQPPGQLGEQRVERLLRPAQHVGQVQVGVVGEQLVRPGQVGLGQAQQRFDLGRPDLHHDLQYGDD